MVVVVDSKVVKESGRKKNQVVLENIRKVVVKKGDEGKSSVKKRVKKDVTKGKDKEYMDINIGSKIMLLMLKNRKKRFSTKKMNATESHLQEADISKLLERHPKIILNRLTYQDVFTNTPLGDVWPYLKQPNRVFATRALLLWQFGGSSFALPETSDTNRKQRIQRLISSGDESFRSLPNGVVTIDDEGLHMQTKTACHAFFGEIIAKLRAAKGDSVEDIIRGALGVFCKRGAVDSGYCASIKS